MTELAVVIGAGVANLVTTLLKGNKFEKIGLTQEELDARKTWLRAINLAIGAVGMVLTAWLMGEPLDVSGVSEAVGSIVTILVTFGFSQGAYYLTK